jgi:hypothetical protein
MNTIKLFFTIIYLCVSAFNLPAQKKNVKQEKGMDAYPFSCFTGQNDNLKKEIPIMMHGPAAYNCRASEFFYDEPSWEYISSNVSFSSGTRHETAFTVDTPVIENLIAKSKALTNLPDSVYIRAFSTDKNRNKNAVQHGIRGCVFCLQRFAAFQCAAGALQRFLEPVEAAYKKP